jgi:hypothetical protein
MVSALVPIWILGGAAIALVILNVVTAGGTTVGDRMDPTRMYRGVEDPRLMPGRSVDPPVV